MPMSNNEYIKNKNFAHFANFLMMNVLTTRGVEIV